MQKIYIFSNGLWLRSFIAGWKAYTGSLFSNKFYKFKNNTEMNTTHKRIQSSFLYEMKKKKLLCKFNVKAITARK